jgi:hypothetical protein
MPNVTSRAAWTVLSADTQNDDGLFMKGRDLWFLPSPNTVYLVDRVSVVPLGKSFIGIASHILGSAGNADPDTEYPDPKTFLCATFVSFVLSFFLRLPALCGSEHCALCGPFANFAVIRFLRLKPFR